MNSGAPKGTSRAEVILPVFLNFAKLHLQKGISQSVDNSLKLFFSNFIKAFRIDLKAFWA